MQNGQPKVQEEIDDKGEHRDFIVVTRLENILTYQ